MKQLLALLFFSITLFALEVGSALPSVTLQGDNGGKLDGTPFNSDTLRGKVYVIFYVDPDEKDLNDPFSDALDAEKFEASKYESVAIINMDATWLPNSAIESSLEDKQKKYPDVLYVKDFKKVLVKKWGIDDDNSDIVIVDKNGTVLYVHAGLLDDTQIKSAISLIKEHM